MIHKHLKYALILIPYDDDADDDIKNKQRVQTNVIFIV